jgi:hypothetical protein
MEYIYEKDGIGGGKKRKAVRRNCENCGKSFLVAIRFIIKGKGNYCCKDCANEAQREKISNRVTLICSNNWRFESFYPCYELEFVLIWRFFV